MLRGDGAGLHTPEGAERKAYTARTFSQPSARLRQSALTEAETVGSRSNIRACWRWPADCRSRQAVKSFGAVGVSGSPGKDDVIGSQAGIDKVADQLK